MNSPVLTRCPEGTSFDGNKGICEANGACLVVSCELTSGSVFVSLGPDSLFYVWCPADANDSPFFMRCPEGQSFNEAIGMCEPMRVTTTGLVSTTTTEMTETTTTGVPFRPSCPSVGLHPGIPLA
jgi:hypothetical protein